MEKIFLYASMILANVHFSAIAETILTNKVTVENLSAHKYSMTEQADYLLYLPKNYDAHGSNHWPVILFLHGIGEGGTDVWTVAKHGPEKFIETHPDFPFILISPQCPFGHKWSSEVVLGILDEVIGKFAVDTNRIYLTGLSMGGFGTWSLATTYPERFAAVAPVCGGGDTLGFVVCNWRGKAPFLKSLPFWVFHGAKDTTVSVLESQRMVGALMGFGCKDVKLTIYPEAGHDAWTETYNNSELYEWFLSHARTSRF